MKEYISLITVLLITTCSFAQVCPQGTKWNNSTKKCETMSIPNNMDVVNFKCPNGYSWVSFKRECLTNKKVKEIYDSLRIEYLKSPELKPRKVEYASATVETVNTPSEDDSRGLFKKKKKDDEPTKTVVVPAPVVVKETTRYTSTSTPGSITISQQDFNELREEILSLKSEVSEIKQTNQQIQQDLVTFQTLIDENNMQTGNNSGETVIASVSADDINYLKSEINSFKTQVAQMQELVNTLQAQQSSMAKTGNYAYNPGVQKTSISQQDVYGKSEVKFKIECPNDYKWLNEESICLRTEAFNNRAMAKAADPNAIIDYGIRDVKCPKYFLWNSKSQNCIPTMHAAIK